MENSEEPMLTQDTLRNLGAVLANDPDFGVPEQRKRGLTTVALENCGPSDRQIRPTFTPSPTCRTIGAVPRGITNPRGGASHIKGQ